MPKVTSLVGSPLSAPDLALNVASASHPGSAGVIKVLLATLFPDLSLAAPPLLLLLSGLLVQFKRLPSYLLSHLFN